MKVVGKQQLPDTVSAQNVESRLKYTETVQQF